MDRTEALTKVTEVLVDDLGIPPEQITLASNLRDDLGMDSLDLVELVSALEDAVNQRVPAAALGEVHTVSDAVDFVVDLAEGKQPIG